MMALQSLRESYLGLSLSTLIDIRSLQTVKPSYPPSLVTLEGIMIDDIPSLQYKALPSMDVTLLGIIVFLHPKIKVFEAVSMMALQSLRESYLGLSLSTLIDESPLQ